MKKILTIMSARPQFVKAYPVSLALEAAGFNEIVVHTGQHYDFLMSQVFFDEMGLKKPEYDLEIGSGSHHYQIGEGIKRLEDVLSKEHPDLVLLYGDTNGTLSGAIAAASCSIPIAHVEAGVRVFNKNMPEERNRVLTDHLSHWLFAPTPAGVTNLHNEGMGDHTHLVGDVMLDSLLLCKEKSERAHPRFLSDYALENRNFILLTMHRAETTHNPQKIHDILLTLDAMPYPTLFPIHPRTQPFVTELPHLKNIRCIQPLSYFEMLQAETHAMAIVTDSGGIQKEAAIFGVPCITLMEQTSWVETVEQGFNTVVGLSTEKLRAALFNLKFPKGHMQAYYGDGQASSRIAEILALSF